MARALGGRCTGVGLMMESARATLQQAAAIHRRWSRISEAPHPSECKLSCTSASACGRRGGWREGSKGCRIYGSLTWPVSTCYQRAGEATPQEMHMLEEATQMLQLRRFWQQGQWRHANRHYSVIFMIICPQCIARVDRDTGPLLQSWGGWGGGGGCQARSTATAAHTACRCTAAPASDARRNWSPCASSAAARRAPKPPYAPVTPRIRLHCRLIGFTRHLLIP